MSGWKDVGVTQRVGSFQKHKQLLHLCVNVFSISLHDFVLRRVMCTSVELWQRFSARFLGRDLSARVLLWLLDSSSRGWSFTMYGHFSSKSSSLHDLISASCVADIPAVVTPVICGGSSDVNIAVVQSEEGAYEKERNIKNCSQIQYLSVSLKTGWVTGMIEEVDFFELKQGFPFSNTSVLASLAQLKYLLYWHPTQFCFTFLCHEFRENIIKNNNKQLCQRKSRSEQFKLVTQLRSETIIEEATANLGWKIEFQLQLPDKQTSKILLSHYSPTVPYILWLSKPQARG